MNVVVYTDASHCNKTKLAACGFAVLVNGRLSKLTVVMMSDVHSSGHAEVYAAIYGLQYAFLLQEVKCITLNVDYESIIFKSRKLNRVPYSELHATIQTIGDYSVILNLKKVKAHSDDRYNNLVDKHCNRVLGRMIDYVKKKATNSLIKQTGYIKLKKFDLDPR